MALNLCMKLLISSTRNDLNCMKTREFANGSDEKEIGGILSTHARLTYV